MVNSSLASCSLSTITQAATNAASPSPLQTRHHQARYRRGITKSDTNAALSKPTMHSNPCLYNSSKLAACAIPQPEAHTTTSRQACEIFPHAYAHTRHNDPLTVRFSSEPPRRRRKGFLSSRAVQAQPYFVPTPTQRL